MNNKPVLFSVTIAVAMMFFAAEVISFSTGAPTNATGSPGNNGLTCVQCHASNNIEKLNWITSTELDNGYSPGLIYGMKAKAEKPGCLKFGFLITIEKPDGTKAGAPIVKDAAKTQIQGTHYITHTTAGTAAEDSAVWLFNWGAPATAMGTVTLHGAFVGANGDHQNSGDAVYLSKKNVILYGTQGVATESKNNNKLYLYPNPADQFVNLTLENPASDARLQIYDATGKIIREIEWKDAITMMVDVSSLPEGLYLLQLTWGNDAVTKKLLIRHR
ncbi:MAG: T9SS type A sorting domain-containing protein [Bacteroidales bacterium]